MAPTSNHSSTYNPTHRLPNNISPQCNDINGNTVTTKPLGTSTVGVPTCSSASSSTGASAQQEQQHNGHPAPASCCGGSQQTKFVSTTRCHGFVGSRLASRYDEDEEDDGADDTIEEEDEDVAEEQEQEVEVMQVLREPAAVTRPQYLAGELRSSYSQNRNRANRYRRSFGGRW